MQKFPSGCRDGISGFEYRTCNQKEMLSFSVPSAGPIEISRWARNNFWKVIFFYPRFLSLQRAILKFAGHTGATPVAGRFTPGAFTNQIQAAFREPRLLIISDPRVDHQVLFWNRSLVFLLILLVLLSTARFYCCFRADHARVPKCWLLSFCCFCILDLCSKFPFKLVFFFLKGHQRIFLRQHPDNCLLQHWGYSSSHWCCHPMQHQGERYLILLASWFGLSSVSLLINFSVEFNLFALFSFGIDSPRRWFDVVDAGSRGSAHAWHHQPGDPMGEDCHAWLVLLPWPWRGLSRLFGLFHFCTGIFYNRQCELGFYCCVRFTVRTFSEGSCRVYIPWRLKNSLMAQEYVSGLIALFLSH